MKGKKSGNGMEGELEMVREQGKGWGRGNRKDLKGKVKEQSEREGKE